MFNHARTLLVNLEGGSLDGDLSPGEDFFAEELIPFEYAAIDYPSYIDRLRNILYGSSPDRAMLNYRTRQFLTMLHSTELEEYLLELDPRITYDIDTTADLVPASRFDPEVTSYGSIDGTLTITGEPMPPDPTGQLRHEFRVDVLSNETIQVTNLVPPQRQIIHDLSLSAGLSGEIELHGAGYTFRVNTNSPGALWNVKVILRPQWSLGDLAVAASKVGEPTLLAIFGNYGIEPWKTFYNLWNDHRELPYKLGGLLLGLIYRSEEIRQFNG